MVNCLLLLEVYDHKVSLKSNGSVLQLKEFTELLVAGEVITECTEAGSSISGSCYGVYGTSTASSSRSYYGVY